MNDKFKPILIGFVFIILFASIMIGAAIKSEDLETGTKDIKCYDKYGNEIKDLVCEERYNLDEDKALIFSILGIGSIMGFFLSVLITLAFALVSGGDE